MAEDEGVPKTSKGFVSDAAGVATNEPVTGGQERAQQTPDQFYQGDLERPELKESPKSHATKGMTMLGYTEAHRLTDTSKEQDEDRKRAEQKSKEN